MTLTGILIAIGTGVIGSYIAWWFIEWRKRRRKLKEGVHAKDGAYDLSDPKYLLGIRADERFGYNPFYYRRDYIDDKIYKRIDNYESLIVIGAPLAGKSRAVYEALKKFQPAPVVIIPSIDDVQREKYPAIKDISDVRRTIILFDDMHKYAVRDSLGHYLRAYRNRGAIIVATCRSGADYERLCDGLKQDPTLLGDSIEIKEISAKTAEEVAHAAGRSVPEKFDGAIGSIFVPIQAVKDSYKEAANEEKQLLQAIKCLYHAGVYSAGEVFSQAHIRRVLTKIEESATTDDEWHDLIRRLEQKGFYKIIDRDIQIEETYLQKIIPGQFDDPDDLKAMANLFSDDFKALTKVSSRAYDMGLVSVKTAAYQKVAIAAGHTCLKLRTYENDPQDYALTQNNLGAAYRMLATVEGKAANCRAAVAAFTEALRVYTLAAFPMDHAMTKNNLGTAYGTLADVEDTAANCRAALAAFTEASRVYTLAAFPMDYAMTQNNLGAAYWTLAAVEDTAANCRAAIAAYTEALRVYTLVAFPMDYAMTQNNLGNAYNTLAEVEDKAANCRAAIAAYTEALRVRTLAAFPMDYAMTQNNLGSTYRTLAEVEDTAANCRKAKESYEEALTVYTPDKLPLQHARTMRNLAKLNAFCEEEE